MPAAAGYGSEWPTKGTSERPHVQTVPPANPLADLRPKASFPAGGTIAVQRPLSDVPEVVGFNDDLKRAVLS